MARLGGTPRMLPDQPVAAVDPEVERLAHLMVVFPHFSGVALLDSVPLNLRGEWRGTTRVPTRVPP
jgi:hypothetical protein